MREVRKFEYGDFVKKTYKQMRISRIYRALHLLYGKRLHLLDTTLIVVCVRAVIDVEALAICIGIAPMLFIVLVIWLQVVASPLGAILFYSVFIPAVVGSAMVDYVRKKRNL